MNTLQLALHAPCPQAFSRALANVSNLLRDYPSAQVELVVNSTALPEALKISDGDIIKRLVLCQNSLNAQQLTAPSHFSVVPAAIVHLAQRQQQGWSYVRA